MSKIHPSVQLGPGVLIGDNVTIEEGCEIGAYTIIQGETHIGPFNKISSHVVIGADPQDHKYKGGGTLRIGRGNEFREFVSIHRGHLSETGTVIGNQNFFCSGSHAGHDCVIGDHNFFANQVLLAGHVEIGDFANVSGNVCVHQFCKIGSHVMISGLSGVRQDVLPYVILQGDPAKVIGINKIGLSRKGWSKEALFQLQDAFRCFRNDLEPKKENVFYNELIEYKASSNRGLTKFKARGSS